MFNNRKISLNFCSGRWLKLFRLSLKTNQSQNFIFISSKFSIKSVAFLAPLPFFPSWLQIKIFTVYISFQINVFVSFICTYPGVKFPNHTVVIFLYRDSWFEIIYIKCVCVCVYIYIYNATLLSHKKEWNSDICYHIDEPRGYYA